MSTNTDFPGNALEDRLRGLIINNAIAGSPALQIPPQSAGHTRPHNQMPIQTEQWTPHMARASLDNQPTALPKPHANFNVQDNVAPAAIVGSPPGGRKRPNQAQRRQMNSQLSLGGGGHNHEHPPQNHGPRQFGHQQQQSWSSPAPHGPSPNRGGFHGHAQRGHHHHFHQPSMSAPHNRQFERTGQNSGSRDSKFVSADQNQSSNSTLPWSNSQPSRQPRFSPPGQHGSQGPRQPPQNRQLYQPGGYTTGRTPVVNTAEIDNQSVYLDKLLVEHVPKVGIEPAEIDEKEEFRRMVEGLCQEAISEYEEKELGNDKFITQSVELKCFGSMASGFATKASDMDLAFLSPLSKPSPESPESPIPRILEKRLLDAGLGARLLTRTRVPIIKLCQNPGAALYEDLKNERSKWESGGTAEGGSDDEELPRPTSPEEEHLDANGKTTVDHKPEAPTTVDSPGDVYNKRLRDLKQSGSQSIGDHYGNAKKLLFKLGGRDVGLNGVGDLSEAELKILHDVSTAFIEGLHDQVLRSSLYPYSFANSVDSTSPMLSLSGVYCQAEGDRLALAWDSRPVEDSTERLEMMNERLIEDWRMLREKTTVDAAVHNKQLHNTLDRLKRISSLQLVFLEQGSHESPMQYQARTSRIIRELGGTYQPDIGNLRHKHVLSLVKVHYVNGIFNPHIKEQLRRTLSRAGDHMEHMFLYHRALHLADDYARALKTTLYDEKVHQTIEDYVTALRREPSATTTLEEHLENIRSDPDIQAAVVLLKGLPDPTTNPKPRDRYFDRLEFPKTGVGIQCDVNFTAQLGLHNTLLLRCYSSADPRVRPLVLFVKSWAKIRGINTPYRGTLSSYGYVLMVLHYLVNVANPFVLPNLQQLKRPPPDYLPPAEREAWDTCQGYDVGFWRNELEIKSLAERGMLNHNHSSIGKLLRGFFEYYAQNNMMSDGCGKRGFEWGREVLSLRTPDGIVTKQEKGWVGARTTIQVVNPGHATTETAATDVSSKDNTGTADAPPGEKQRNMSTEPEVKEIRHRYLFAIEDPFEITHNVARTVTHNGIVSIRDEFRRAWRIIRNIGDGDREELLADLTGGEKEQGFLEFLELLHGKGEPHDEDESQLAV